MRVSALSIWWNRSPFSRWRVRVYNSQEEPLGVALQGNTNQRFNGLNWVDYNQQLLGPIDYGITQRRKEMILPVLYRYMISANTLP
jgi:hypothetical protein